MPRPGRLVACVDGTMAWVAHEVNIGGRGISPSSCSAAFTRAQRASRLPSAKCINPFVDACADMAAAHHMSHSSSRLSTADALCSIDKYDESWKRRCRPNPREPRGRWLQHGARFAQVSSSRPFLDQSRPRLGRPAESLSCPCHLWELVLITGEGLGNHLQCLKGLQVLQQRRGQGPRSNWQDPAHTGQEKGFGSARSSFRPKASR